MIGKELMRHIDGVGLFPLISLVLFFVLFTAVIIYAFTMNKEKADAMGAIPLENHKNQEND